MALVNDILRLFSERSKGRNGDSAQTSITSTQLVQDNITPYKICLLILMREYLETKPYGVQKEDTIWYTDDERMKIMLTLMELLKTPDISLGDLQSLLNKQVNQQLIQRFEMTLRKLLEDGANELASFFDRISEPIKDDAGNEITDFTNLNRMSVMGLFLRAMIISFKLLPLEGLMTGLYTDLTAYCKSSMPDSISNLDSNFAHKPPRQSGRTKPSKWQAERRVTRLAYLLEDNEQEAGTPAEVAEELSNLLRSYPNLYRAHYVQYLNYMRVNEYCGARECLNQYFDKIALSETSVSSNADDVNRCSRYASLSLASLYARFGHRDQALHSVKEAVKLAQEANDKECLAEALIWLQHLHDFDGCDDINQLACCQTSASSNHLPAVMIKILKSSNLKELPKKIFSELEKGRLLPAKTSPKESMATQRSRKALLAHKSFQSSLWLYYDRSDMSNLVMQTALRKTFQKFEMILEPQCLALCTLSNHQFYHGNYDQADALLRIAKEMFPQPYKHSAIWLLTEYCQLFDRAFYHSDGKTMTLACDNLAALDPLECKLRYAVLSRVQGHFHVAHKLLNELLSNQDLTNMKRFRSVQIYIRVMRELIELLCCMNELPTAMKHIMECVRISREHHLHLSSSLCHLYTSYIQLVSGNKLEAFNTVKTHLPVLLIAGTQFHKACAQLLYVKCKIAASLPNQRTECIKECISLLKAAEENFRMCEAFRHLQDTLLYMSLVFNMIGDTESRNIYALRYKENQQNLLVDLESSSMQFYFLF